MIFLEILLGLRRANKAVKHACLLKELSVISDALDVAETALDVVEIEELLNAVATNAAAYGFEVGRGQPMELELNTSPDNPFRKPNWWEGVTR